MITQAIAKLGENIRSRRFARFKVGEVAAGRLQHGNRAGAGAGQGLENHSTKAISRAPR